MSTAAQRADADEWAHSDLAPGETVVYDYRESLYTAAETRDDRAAKLPDTFRIAQWNIERGTQFDGIVRTLRACEADIICLQELDVDCRRSGYRNVPRDLAKALSMQCVFVCEFEELDDAARSPHNAVGPASQWKDGADPHKGAGLPARLAQRLESGQAVRHLHGNAILSRRADLSRDVIVLRHTTDVDWETAGMPLGEPRHGFRSALRVCVSPADRTFPAIPPLYIYCCHFEVFCGALARVRQLGDCVADAKSLLLRAAAAGGGAPPSLPSFIIAGDLNTMAHSVVRFSPKYAKDRLRLLSIGETEAMWLQRKVLARGIGIHVTKGCCPLSYRFPSFLTTRVYEAIFDSALFWRLAYGFSRAEVARLDNTKTCFYDTADKYSSVTLDNPDYHGFVRGKLDWLLISHLLPAPFRVARGGARPVDIDALIAAGSVQPRGSSAAYLKKVYKSDAAAPPANARATAQDEARELDPKTRARWLPPDGYLLFNEHYTDSDHKGILMTVQQPTMRGSMPQATYPPYGATYTNNVYALGAFLLSRGIPLALVAAAGMRVYAYMSP